MNGFTLRLENLDGRDMPSATWAAGLVSESAAVHVAEMDQVSVQRNGGLSGGIEGTNRSDGAVILGGLAGSIEGTYRSDGAVVAGGLTGGVVGSGGLTGGVVLGGAGGGVTADRFAPIDVDGSSSVELSQIRVGEEIPTRGSKGEEIPTF
jgi:hypothetical protein